MTTFTIRAATAADSPAVLALNDVEVVWTSPVDSSRLATLAAIADHFRIVEQDGTALAFLLGMSSRCAYENDNFAWFGERYESFLYVDRIVVGAAAKGLGIGRALYEEAFAHAREQGLAHVVCEYTHTPRNAPSARFHAAMGFEEVGQRLLEDSGKVMSMQHRSSARMQHR